jgi:hypothetical protein
MGETGASEGWVDDRPRCSDLDERDLLLERLKRYHEIVGGVVRERVVPCVPGPKNTDCKL